jgi:hypothetical protein
MDKSRAQGVDILLVSGFRSLYDLHGCTHVGKVARYYANCDMDFPKTRSEVKPFRPEDLPAWAALYRKEPVRFHRPYDDFQKIISRPSECRRGELYSVWEQDNIIAYAAFGHSKDGIYIDEYAGSRLALLGSIQEWCEDFKVPGISITVPAHDLELSLMLDSIGAEAKYGSTGGTITILHFPRLCRKLMPMFQEILGSKTAGKLNFQDQNGAYTISLDDNKIEFDDARHIARLIFGNPAGRDERTEINAQGQLLDVLESIFPIPRPEYGLSFI